MSRRRELEHVVAVIVRRHRLDPFGFELRQVGCGHDAAVGLHLFDNRRCDVALVERVAAVLLNQAQRCRETWIPNDAVEGRCGAVQKEGLARVGVGVQRRDDVIAREIRMPPFGQRPALLRHARRPLERLLERHRSETFEHRVVSGNRAGNGRSIDAGSRHRRASKPLDEELVRPSGGRPSRRREAVQLLVPRRPHEREKIAADARVVLRRHVEHRAGGDGRVDGVAASLQDFEARLRRQRIARCDHAMACEHFRAPLHQPALGAHTRDRIDGFARIRDLRCRRAECVGRLRNSGHSPATGDYCRSEDEKSTAHG